MQRAINQVLARDDLSRDDMAGVMRTIMTGGATDAQIGGFLIGLRMKGETVTEIAAAAGVMRELAARVEVAGEHLVDTCGTGGDASGTFNVSTASAFVAAAAGARVAKHGNRSISSKSGSADVLEAAGVNLQLTPAQVGRCIDEVGVGFMFAPAHHGAMKHAIGPRKEMGVRTLFNVLGPLTNPAAAPNQVLGVFSAELLEPLAEVLKRLGSRHVLVVHADDGLDEISISAPTRIAELRDGAIYEYVIEPQDFDVARAPLDAIRADSAEASLALVRQALGGEPGPARDIVRLNAGAAIYAAGVRGSLADGIDAATAAIDSGEALVRLERLVALSKSMAESTDGS